MRGHCTCDATRPDLSNWALGADTEQESERTPRTTLGIGGVWGTSPPDATDERQRHRTAMSPRPASVSAELELRFVVPGSPSLPVTAEMTYDREDPYAVRVAFHTGASDVVEWTFARSLLTDGVTHPVGEGDVQVWPSHSAGRPVVCLSLSSPSGRALFEAPLSELVEFLTKSYAVVPTGSESEHVDVEAELALLLWSEPEI